jgi:hypothetical protein
MRTLELEGSFKEMEVLFLAFSDMDKLSVNTVDNLMTKYIPKED